MNKKIVLGLFVLVLLIPYGVSAGGIGGNDGEYQEEVSYPMPPVPRGDYVVVGHNADNTKFWIEPKGESVKKGSCTIYEVKVYCIDPGIAPPPNGTVVGLKLNGTFQDAAGRYQRLVFEKIVDQECELFLIGLWNRLVNPKSCCTTCTARFRKMDGNTKLREWFYKFTDVTHGGSPLVLTGVRLTDPQVFRFDTICENGECRDMTVTLDGVDKTESAWRDCNGQMGCAWFQYNQSPRRACFSYWDRGCLCKVCAEVTDPEVSVDDETD